MIPFKIHLLIEEFRKAGIGVYKNPTRAELAKAVPWARAFGTLDGDLYVAEKGSSKSFHRELFNALRKAYKEDGLTSYINDKILLQLQRIENTSGFAIGEQLAEVEPSSNAKAILKKLSRSRKPLQFVAKNILEFDVPDNVSGWKPGFKSELEAELRAK